VSSEVAPFSKTGGLADVSGALLAALARGGHRVTLVTPRYRGIAPPPATLAPLDLDLGPTRRRVGVHEHQLGHGARILFIDDAALYDREGIYGVGGADYADNAERFALLSLGAAALAAREVRPQVIHAHDWQAGLTPLYARRFAELGDVPVVFTIHNLAFQGLFPATRLPGLGLDGALFTAAGLEYWGHVSFLKAGINFSDVLTTVSPRYAQEILTPEFGFGFDGILAARRDRLVGILNGIDADVWNPATDPWLPAHYDGRDLSGKRECKRALLREFGLPHDETALHRPIVGMVSRLTDQKGFDLLAGLAGVLPGLDAVFVLLCTGEARYEALWTRMTAQASGRIAARIGFDERLAHLIEAGADLFLMPSRFEPCGLNQMYSMRYGTVPVVRATGGLYDTVEDFDPGTGRGTGFRFDAATPGALLATLQRALATWRDRKAWGQLMQAGMGRNHAWDVSAREYVKVYRQGIAARRAARRSRP